MPDATPGGPIGAPGGSRLATHGAAHRPRPAAGTTATHHRRARRGPDRCASRVAVQDTTTRDFFKHLVTCDQVIDGPTKGTVRRLDLRVTHVRTNDGRLVLVPNAELFVSSSRCCPGRAARADWSKPPKDECGKRQKTDEHPDEDPGEGELNHTGTGAMGLQGSSQDPPARSSAFYGEMRAWRPQTTADPRHVMEGASSESARPGGPSDSLGHADC